MISAKAAVFWALILIAHPLAADEIGFTADRVSYFGASGQETTILEGNVQLVVEARAIFADKVEITGQNYRYIEAEGSVQVDDSENDMMIQGNRLEYDREAGIIKIAGAAFVEDRANAVVVRCGFIEYREENEIFKLEINVRLFNDDVLCRGEAALYRRDAQSLEITGNPEVYKEENSFSAVTIFIDLSDNSIIMSDDVSGQVITEVDAAAEDTANAPAEENAESAENAPAGETPAAESPIAMEDAAGDSVVAGNAETGAGEISE